MHGQAEDALGVIFTDGEITFLVAEITKGGLEVKGFRVVDGRRDAGDL